MNALDFVYVGVAGVTAPWWARKARGGWGERLGRISALGAREDGLGRVLLHAVSVGEVNALRHLVPLVAREARVIVSASTDTGLARAKALYSETCDVVRYPLDASFAVRRFLDAVKPDVVGLVELELWPNFLGACGRRSIPVCVINGRLSARSFKGYRRIGRWVRPMFRQLAFAAVQDEEYAARFEAMGVEACLLTGSMKWDSAEIVDKVAGADALAREMGIDRSSPLIVAGSTGPGEEALLDAACPEGVQLLCAPRKPERFDEAAAAMPGCVRRSEVRVDGSGRGVGGRDGSVPASSDSKTRLPPPPPGASGGGVRRDAAGLDGRDGNMPPPSDSKTRLTPPPPGASGGGVRRDASGLDGRDGNMPPPSDSKTRLTPPPPGRGRRYLLDTIGELRAAYSLADVVVIGRSFGDLYGSDPIEAAALGKAVVMGARASDFAHIVAALEGAGGIVRTTRDALAGELRSLLGDAARRRALGEAARACVRAQQGASARHAELLLSLLEGARSARR